MQITQGKTAFITGGGSGIGFAMARTFMNAGMNVVIADASDENLRDAKEKLNGTNGKYLIIKLDVTDRIGFAKAADAAEAHFGNIHVLCNNAGVGTANPISEAGYDDWDNMMNINLGGVINGIVTFLPRMRRHGEGGHIVNTSSISGIIPLPDAGGIYTTSKFAVRGLSESLRLSLVPDRIGVSILFPGLTKTRILDLAKAAIAENQDEVDEVSAGFVNAQKYAMDPMDLAGAVLDAIRENKPYILAHYEFIDEVNSLNQELMNGFRTDLPMHPQRAEFENGRRMMIDDIKRQMKPW